MTTHPSNLTEAARLWAMRVADPSFDDWDGLTQWLETSPAHLAAYEAAADADEWAAQILAGDDPEKENSRRRQS